MNPPDRYADAPFWEHYQRFVPARARLRADNAPDESFWPWRRAAVHLDRYARADAAVKVILLHGGGGNGRLAAPFGVLLRERGYEALAPDLPGYGLTRCPPRDTDYGAWIDLVSDLVDAETARDGRPVVLFGLSLGGMLAYQAACRNPRVRGVIATTLADPSDPPTRDQLARSPLVGRAGLRLLRALRGVLDDVRVPIKWFSRMHLIANDPAVVGLLLRDRTAAASRVPLRFLRTLMASSPEIPPEAFDRCPVLLAHPGADRMTPLALSAQFFARIRGDKTLVVLENAGHMPLESPGIEQLEAAVMAFLAEVAARAARDLPLSAAGARAAARSP